MADEYGIPQSMWFNTDICLLRHSLIRTPGLQLAFISAGSLCYGLQALLAMPGSHMQKLSQGSAASLKGCAVSKLGCCSFRAGILQ